MIIDICIDDSLDELFFSTLREIQNSGEKLAGNYANFKKSDFLSFPVFVQDGVILAFSGLQYDVRKWGEKAGRVSSRFWLHSSVRRKGIANFKPDPNWTWHNAEFLIPWQLKVARDHGLNQVFISRDRKDRRSFPKFIELVNAFSDVNFQVSPDNHDVCNLPATPDACIQLVAWANLDQSTQPFILPKMHHHPLDIAFLDPTFVPNFDEQRKMYVTSGNGVINPDLSHLLSNKGLRIRDIQIFTYQPNQTLGIHVDDCVIDNKAKINHVIGGESSILEWWNPIDILNKEISTSPMGTKYLKYEEHECTLVQTASVKGTFIMNSGVPHRMKNGSDRRICISAPIFHESGAQCQFDELVRIFS